ncbi:MAG: LysM peptidoglycan-binding domain-containing protein, partial [Bacillota bacterium]
GLLVGLAFIIVIGILLSDHFTSTMQPQQAPLLSAGDSVLKGTATPGAGMASSNNTRIGDVKPDRVVDLSGRNPKDPVITVGPSARLNTTETAQVPGNVLGNAAGPLGVNDSTATESTIPGTITPPTATGELTGTGDHEQSSPEVQTANGKEYTAEPGDTLGKIAAKALGKNTKSNRDAIIKANPSLQKDPNRIKAGETYIIPSQGTDATARTTTDAGTPTAQSTRPANSELVYTTKSGDSLWKIAVEQVGSPSAVAQIKELNRDVLKNGASLKPNMKLRLPPKAVASAN